MFSPMPHNALGSPAMLPASPIPCSPGEVASKDLNTVRPMWYDVDEATQDLREVLSCKTTVKFLPDWIPAFETRCLSSASTAATSPPPPNSFLSPESSPDRDFVASPDLNSDIECPTNKQTQCPPGALDKSSWLQARKVFVGGIPQAIDQNGLYRMLSKVGKVKKAWLQLFHNDRSSKDQTSTAKKHRGFGFVIFYERQSIDELLGDEFSRFVCFDGDLKLEIKRSIGKTTVTIEEQQQCVESTKTPLLHVVPAAPQTWQSVSPPPPSQTWQNRSPPCPQSWQHGSPAAPQPMQVASPCLPQAWQNISSPAGSQFPVNASPAVPQSWQNCPQQTFVYVNLPCVPAFPFAEPTPVHWMPSDSTAISPVVPQPATEQDFNYSFVPNAFLDAFHGQTHLNKQELKAALLEALPERYDD